LIPGIKNFTSKGRHVLTKVLMSACLAGLRTRYDGAPAPHPRLDDLVSRGIVIPVCPELLGGLGIPRAPCHFAGGDGNAVLSGHARVVDRTGLDRTAHFLRGAQDTLVLLDLVRPDFIIFKDGSPSCGVHRVDVQGTKMTGCGVTSALLKMRDLTLLSEEDPLPEGSF
jgi:uncharacterized protein YbbK (DUF523 family)